MRSHTLRLLACCTSVLALVPLVPPCSGQATGRRLYVSPSGDDAWSGTLEAPNAAGTDGPLASLPRAQERVRELNAGGPTAAVTVLLREGSHQLSRPLVFTPADSGTAEFPVTYAAYPGESPEISGGVPVGGWEPEGRLWRTSVARTHLGQPWRFNQLYVNGSRRTRARTPNRGEFFRTDGPAGRHRNRSFHFHEGDMQEWDRLQDAIVVVYHSWETSIHHIRSLDMESRSVLLREPAPWEMGRWERQQRYYVENVFEALDEPGEWYLNLGTGTLYYYPLPGETPDTVEAIAPVVGATLVEIAGDPSEDAYVEHLHFRGLAFRHGNSNLHRLRNPGQGEIYQPGLVQAQGLRHSSFVDCAIGQTGAHAIWLGAGCSHNLVQRCHLHDLGGGGVYIGGGSGIQDHFPTGHNTVDNCFIHDGSYMFRGAHGVWIGRSSHNTVTHNEISNFDYSGISCGWSWGFQPSSANHNILDFNYIHHLSNGEGLSDMGAIYTLGLSPGTTIRNNHIHDVYNYAHVSHGSGIYPDEGSTDILIENNVVHRVRTCPIYMHYGKECTVRNNIFALGGVALMNRSREDVRCHYAAVGNILYGGDNPTMLRGRWNNHDWEVGRNVYWSTGGEPDFAGMDFAAWQVHGKDGGSIVADPLFVDPENGDFRLRPESPALAMGFEPIDVTRAGLYGDPEWTGLPSQFPNRERNEIAAPVEPPFRVNFDFEADEPGDVPGGSTAVQGENNASVLVCGEFSAGGTRSLRFTDAPDQRYTWTPHIFYRPNPSHTEGAVRLLWDMRNSPEAPASFFVELRQYEAGNPFLTGPTVTVDEAGTVSASGQEIGVLPAGEWASVAIDLELGEDAPRTYRIALTVPGREPVVRVLPYQSEGFRRIDWLGIASTSETATVFHIDNLKLGSEEEVAQPPRRRPPARQRLRRRQIEEPPNDQMLVGHWNFQGSDGVLVEDLSGYENHGELWASLATGDFGTALASNPVHPHMIVVDDESLDFGTGDFSVDLWICPTLLASHHAGYRRRFLSRSEYPRIWWVMDMATDGRIFPGMGIGRRSVLAPGTGTRGAAPKDVWTHFAMVVDRANREIRFFLNGEPDSVHEIPDHFDGALSISADLTVGATWQPFVGLLDEVRIFKRALGEAEIRAAYERERGNRTSAEHRIIE